MTATSYLPAGTISLSPAPSDVYDARPGAGRQYVTADSIITLASASITGTMTANFVATSVATAITAKASGTQATGTVLTAANNFISKCATDADSVVLPSAAPVGAPVYVRNDGAKSAQVFAVTPGTINGVSTATGVALAATASATYRQSATGVWTS